MNIKLIAILIILTIGTFSSSYSQNFVSNSTKGYYISDSVFVNNIWIKKENSNLSAIRVIIPEQNNHEAVILSPSDIKEYGFENGEKYISSNIIYKGEKRKVFLEEVQKVSDLATIYCYYDDKEYFFINKQNSFANVSPDGIEIRELYKKNSPCNNVEEIEKYKFKLNKYHIQKFYNVYMECNTNFFQKWEFGLTAGTGIYMPKVVDQNVTFDMGLSYAIGAFMHIPIDEYILFRPELLFSFVQNRQHYTGKSINDNWTENYYQRSSIQLPLLIRYNFNESSRKSIPYIETGALIDKSFQSSLVNNNMLYGFAFGCGFKYKLNFNHSIYFNLRYNYLFGKYENYSTGVISDQSLKEYKKITNNALMFNISYYFTCMKK